MATTYDRLLAAGTWRPIARCPGRSVWRGARDVTPADLAGSGATVEVFTGTGAPDPVHVVHFDDGGGLLSYRRPDGTFVHTLNTPEGLARKLAELGKS